MATLVVTVNEDLKTSGSVIEFADSSVASPASDLNILLAAIDGSLTVTKIALSSWGSRLKVKSGTPTSLSFGTGSSATVSIPLEDADTQSLTLGIDVMGSATPVHKQGAYWGELVITWNDGGASQTFRLILKGVIGSASAGPIQPLTLSDLQSRVVSGWSLGSSTPTEANPLGLGWSIKDTGHLAFAKTYLKPHVDAGVKQFFFHQVLGQMHRLIGEDDICADSFVHAEELGINPLWYTLWDPMVSYMESINPGGVHYVYNGSWRLDQNYITSRASSDVFGFIDRFFRAMRPYLKHPSIRYCGDVPAWSGATGNPTVTNGETRYELQKAVSRILELTGRGEICTEPRGLDADTQWHASAGFGKCIVENTWRRNNPAFYTDAANATTDAHINGRTVLRWHIDQDVSTLAHQIANTLAGYGSASTHKCVIGMNDYIMGGSSMTTLLSEVNTIIAKIAGA